jgi:hypothetical protein
MFSRELKCSEVFFKEGFHMVQKFSKNIFKISLSICLASILIVLRLIKISPLWGGCFSYFSLTDVLMPLSGLAGFGMACFFFATRIMVRSLFFNIGLIAAVYHIPGLCASFYWCNTQLQRAIGIILPVMCMVLFILHPVGRAAALYALLWSIPLLLSLYGARTPLQKSLVSTFIAHSIGSVIWLYTKQLAPAEWLALIPVVIIERFTFACIMTMVYYTVSYGHQVYKAYMFRARNI